MDMTLEKKLNKLLAGGASTDEVYKRLNEALDAIEAEEKQKADKKKNEREEALKDYEEEFHSSYMNENMDLDDVAALAVLVCESDYPEWTAKDIDGFFETVKETIKLAAQTVGKSNAEITKMLAKDFSDRIGETMKKVRGPLENPFAWDDSAISKFLKDLDLK